MSTGNPDLFVICKSCGAEVSPYITECPYCGNRLRKRAPKLDREGRVTERRRLRKRPPTPSLPRLRRGEIPGIRPELHPYATIALVIVGLVGCLIWRAHAVLITDIGIVGVKPGSHWWRLITSPFVYNNTGYAFASLGAIGLYGWLLERRHGPLPVIALFALGGVGGTAATAALYDFPVVLGANGGALALLCAWAIPDLIGLRHGEEIEGDLLGTAAIALVVALMPLAVTTASWVSDGVGVLGGIAIGVPIALIER
jgi:membrane associated rhomboid family serine protease